MATKNPYASKPVKSAKPTAPAQPADAQIGAPSQEELRNRFYAQALDAAPRDARPPSIQAATKYRVSTENYTPREKKAAKHALDFNGVATSSLSFVEYQGFPGFMALSLLAQLPEYRAMHEILADECIRCWGKVISTGDVGPDKLQELEAELDRVDMQAVVRQAVIHDQQAGRAHVFFKFKGDETTRDLPLLLKPYSIRKGSFEGLRNIEAYWVTPNSYNSTDPTRPDFYKPASWWALSTETHASRLQTLVSRPVPDMLKPAYSFAGVSMTQLAMPYVDNWLRTRQSVSDTVKQFSVSGVRVDMNQILAPGGGQDLENRAQLINAYRDNRNILFLDMATEEFFQVNTPLSGLDALQAQSQEHMSAVSHIPLVKLFGVTPTGLNASSEGEIRVWYDYVSGYQGNVLQSLMRTTLRIAQLSLWGQIDPDIDWSWNPLLELTDLEMADKRNKDANTDSLYFEMGAVSSEQITETLNSDPDSRYAGVLDAPATIEEIPDDDISGIATFIAGINPAEQAANALLPAPDTDVDSALPQNQMAS